MVVRPSRGSFAPERAGDVRSKLDEGCASLEPALRQLRGLLHYSVAVDEQASTMVSLSVWTGLAEAKQMGHARADAGATGRVRGARRAMRPDPQLSDAVDDHAMSAVSATGRARRIDD